MYLNQTWLRRLATLGALFAILLSSTVQGQQPELTEAFVYGINATTPGEVFANLSPPQVEDIYILANRANVLSPKLTNVYFWPLTQRYRGHWETLNKPLDGVLEIVEDGHVISTVNLASYTVHYVAAGTTEGELYIGGEALEADALFSFSREASLQAMMEFRQARMRWLEESRLAQIAGEPVPIREEPKRPSSFTTLSVGLQKGFPLMLEAGSYQIRMRDPEGKIITDSERTVHVFESRQTSLGFEVIHEDRLAAPEQVNDASDIIPAEPGSTIYLRPHISHQYPAQEIEYLRDTQFNGDAKNRWLWLVDSGYIHSTNDVLEIVRWGKLEDQISYAPYSVRLTLDRESGYEIVPYDEKTPRLTPRVDISGYRIELPPNIDQFTIRLKTETDLPYDGAVRQVRVLPNDLSVFLFPVTIFFVVLALSILLIWKRIIPHRKRNLNGL